MKTGPAVLLLLFGILILSDTYFVMVALQAGEPSRAIGIVVRMILTAGLGYATYKGQTWARYLTSGLMALGGLIALSAVVQTRQPLFLGVLLYCAAFVYALNGFPPVTRFLKEQAAKE